MQFASSACVLKPRACVLRVYFLIQARIKKIMQLDDDVGKVAAAVPLLVCIPLLPPPLAHCWRECAAVCTTAVTLHVPIHSCTVHVLHHRAINDSSVCTYIHNVWCCVRNKYTCPTFAGSDHFVAQTSQTPHLHLLYAPSPSSVHPISDTFPFIPVSGKLGCAWPVCGVGMKEFS